VTVRDLRNRGGEILAEVARGETLVVTRDGEPIAELRPLPRRGPSVTELIAARRHVPPIDPARLRADIDEILDMSL
jgi:prevent-host-death family protein